MFFVLNIDLDMSLTLLSPAQACRVDMISVPIHGSLSSDMTNLVSPGDPILITCDTGYQLTPTTTVTCITRTNTANVYSDRLPTCEGKLYSSVDKLRTVSIQ